MADQIVIGNVECLDCHNTFKFEHYRVIDGNIKDNRRLIFNNEINVTICPYCYDIKHQPLTLLYLNSHKGIALWYEPIADKATRKEILYSIGLLSEEKYITKAIHAKRWKYFQLMMGMAEVNFDIENRKEWLKTMEKRRKNMRNLMKADKMKNDQSSSGQLLLF